MKLEWTTQKRKVSDLKGLDINPRKISSEQMKKLEASLEKFNLAEIPAITLDDVVLGGTQRVTALMAMGRGHEYIDVRVPNRHLTADEIKEYNLISNTHAGSWDVEILEREFAGSDFEDLGIDLVALNRELAVERHNAAPQRSATTKNETSREIDIGNFEFDSKCPKCGFEYNAG